MKTILWDCDDIIIEDRARKRIKEKSILELMDSIQRIGLREPPTIRVRINEDGCGEGILVAGLHRVEACKRLGLTTIDCVEFKGSEAEARLWEIAENLFRAELTKLERSEHIHEWVRLTEKKQREVSGQLAQKPQGGRPEGGVSAAVRELGIERTEARRAKKIAKTSPEAKKAAMAAGLSNNQSALVRIASEPSAEAQLAAVQREKARQEEIKTQRKTPRPTQEQRIQTAKEYLASRLDEDEIKTFGEMLIGICDPLAVVLMRETV